jgi:signal recognition particle receptor subunit beta
MASVNPHTRELVYKLVFYGPGLGGKTTTLQHIYDSVKTEHRGKMVSLATPTDRTLYFDFLPLEFPKIRGMNVRLQLFTVPGQVYYAATRKLVLSGADGIVFVADSHPEKIDANTESFEDLKSNLTEHNRTLEDTPHTFHWNKRDLPNAMPVDDLEKRFNSRNAPSFGTVATRGEGVFEGLERIMQLVMRAHEKEGGPASRNAALELAEAMRTLAEPAKRDVRHSDSPATRIAINRDELSGTSVSEVPLTANRPPSGQMVAATSPAPVSSDAPKPQQTSNSPGLFSFALLFHGAERDAATQCETMLSAKDATNAILACDVLVARILASSASMLGTFDAPRDPAAVALLLRLDGARYVWFRSKVRAARHREQVSLVEAYEAYGFSVEVRRARDSLRGYSV